MPPSSSPSEREASTRTLCLGLGFDVGLGFHSEPVLAVNQWDVVSPKAKERIMLIS